MCAHGDGSDRTHVLEAMMDLQPAEQEILFLRYWERPPYREIARRLGLSEAACRQRHRRAIVRLGRRLR